MHEMTALIEARIRRTHAERIMPALYRSTAPLAGTRWTAPGEPVGFTEAAGKVFTPVSVGESWGKPWGTTWFRFSGEIPADWPTGSEVEAVIDLGFLATAPGFQAEGLVWSEEGQPIKGLHPRNRYVRMDGAPGQHVSFLVEAAANPDVGGDWTFEPTPLGDLTTAGVELLYRFDGARLGLLDAAVFGLERDWWTLEDLMMSLPADSTRRARILRALESAADTLDPRDVASTAASARDRLAPALAVAAGDDTHWIAATGHAHIDSAWLWPVRETIRKCARTFANVLELMDRYPDFVFAASSAQQYAWIKERYPELFERIRQQVALGRWVPVGGMWVEPDTNMTGGESIVRQFVMGKQFFMEEFGVETTEVWLPDSFGYSAALPQIALAAGSENFLTQKTSKNETDRIPHSTFWWEGIDGSRIFAHLPPVDTYHSDLSAADLRRAEGQNGERGLSDSSLVPFGYGDGGGGPTREMVEVARRKADLQGSQRVTLSRPDDFFARARAELHDPAVWSGELYLELHRGTYTSQARTKLGNRRCEHLLYEAELWATTAAVRTGEDYPTEALRACWRSVLLNQFHDILSGAGIAWVHQEAERDYSTVVASLEALIAASLAALGVSRKRASAPVAFNSSPFPVSGVPAMSAGRPAPAPAARGREEGSKFVLENAATTARFDARGHLLSLRDNATGRDALRPGEPGNVLELFEDTPSRFDAWDIDAAYQRVPPETGESASVRLDGDELEIIRVVGSSPVVQRARLLPETTGVEIETRVDWKESQKLLKLVFPFDIHAESTSSEIQFGHVDRPLHANTSWDAARFEISGHRWVRVEEPGFGVTVVNDRVYGRDVVRRGHLSGGVSTVVRESLLRSPLFPDPGADRGEHSFRHSIVVGSLLEGIAEGYRLNLRLREAAASTVDAIVVIEGLGVVIDVVKLAEDGSGDVIVRLHEARGSKGQARLVSSFPVTSAVRVDLLERPLQNQPTDPLGLDLRAFELVTLRLSRRPE